MNCKSWWLVGILSSIFREMPLSMNSKLIIILYTLINYGIIVQGQGCLTCTEGLEEKCCLRFGLCCSSQEESNIGTSLPPSVRPFSGELPSSTNGLLHTSTNGPSSTSAKGPISTSTKVPLPTSTKGPISTSTKGPISTSTDGPLSTSTKGPLSTSTKGPISTSTDGPLNTSTKVPLSTSTNGPLSTSTKGPLSTSTKVPLPVSTKEPLPSLTNEPLTALSYGTLQSINNKTILSTKNSQMQTSNNTSLSIEMRIKDQPTSTTPATTPKPRWGRCPVDRFATTIVTRTVCLRRTCTYDKDCSFIQKCCPYGGTKCCVYPLFI